MVDSRPPGAYTRRDFLHAAGVGAGLLATAWLPPFPAATQPPFPPDFLWGAGSSAYQIEGAAEADGKGQSVWDTFVRRRGVIADGQTGANACDFYHLYKDDIARMRALGLRAFRFSCAWTRIQPDGRGPANSAGLDFYRRLVDALLAAGIEPIPTLFHWDTPLALERRGGWQRRDMADRFADYASLVAGALGDRVRTWLTINEPRSFIGGGYVAGVQAPGLRLARRDALAAAHIVLLAHGRAVQALRAHAPRPVRIGIPNDISPALPLTGTDTERARLATFASPLAHFTASRWWDENAWWFDPIYAGAYPAVALAALGADAPALAPGDMQLIHQPLDFCAANMYGGRLITAAPNGATHAAPWPAGFPITTFGWQVVPQACYWAPRWLHQRYKLPIFVTENGCATRDWVSLDGAVHDPQRTDFTHRYLRSLAQAAAESTPLLGYLHWALLDNFEWQAGYTQRFGLIHVDFQTQKRTLKDSAHWFARTIATHGATLASTSPD